jgi:hypothetical protein
MPNTIRPKPTNKPTASKQRSFGPDRKGESSAGSTGKTKKASVAATRNTTSR